jgi:hypothetical protein
VGKISKTPQYAKQASSNLLLLCLQEQGKARKANTLLLQV